MTEIGSVVPGPRDLHVPAFASVIARTTDSPAVGRAGSRTIFWVPNSMPAPDQRTGPWIPLVACGVWVGLWFLTPGLRADGVGSWFSDDEDRGLLVECLIAVIVGLALAAVHPRFNRVIFARSRLMWLYALPAGLAVVLPLHYSLPLPLAVYLAWMTVSVLWQDYLTFGLLQSYVAEYLPTWATIAVVAGMFWLGHAVVLPHRFGVTSPLASLAMLSLGAVFALLRARLGTLHLLLALHLSFYFLLA